MADTKKLPDDVYAPIESEDNSAKKKALAKEELAKTDTFGNKAKAVAEDAFTTTFGWKAPGYLNRPFNKATKEHGDKVKRLKEEAGMKKGGKVSSASKRADGIAQRGKTKGRMV